MRHLAILSLSPTEDRKLELRIPEGINYECAGCGQCCFGWPVPLTEGDYKTLDDLAKQGLIAAPQVKPLASPEPGKRLFTRVLGKRSDGGCEFLGEDNLCQLHAKFGADSKPSMCRLFPYTFVDTPSGVYASISFYSNAAVANSGAALSAQSDILRMKSELFRSVFPDGTRDWSKTQISDGIPLSWDDYLPIEEELLRLLRTESPARIDKRLLGCSRFVVSKLPRGTNLERFPSVKARPKVVDQLLLQRFFELYLTDDPYTPSSVDLYTEALLADLLQPPATVQLQVGGTTYGITQLLAFNLGTQDHDIENLLYRFVLNKMYGKIYFSSGFAGLSLLAGIHHLILLVVLIRLKTKALCIAQGQKKLEFLQVAEIVKKLDQRLSHVTFNPESSKILEVMLTSPERVERLLSLAD